MLIPVYGYCAVGLAHDGAVPPGAAGYGAALGGLALVAHLAVRLRAPYADPLLLPIGVLLNGLGLVLIYRLDLETADAAAPAQLIWSGLGVALFTAVVLLLRDYRTLARYAYLGVVAALVLMIAPSCFPAVNGARIWIRVAGLSLQPGEFAKVLLAVFFAAYLADNRAALAYAGRRVWRFRRLQLPTGRVLGPVLAVWTISLGVLVVERDLGTSLLFFGLFVILLYVASGRTGWIAIGLVLSAAGAFLVGTLEPHVHSRVADWLHPFASTEAYQGPGQLAQSLFAFSMRRAARHRPGRGALDPDRLRGQVRLHPGHGGRGAGADGPDRAVPAVRAAGGPGPPGGAGDPGAVRQAPGRGTGLDCRAAGLRDRRMG